MLRSVGPGEWAGPYPAISRHPVNSVTNKGRAGAESLEYVNNESGRETVVDKKPYGMLIAKNARAGRHIGI